jgi:integrase/recombinase XerD
MSGDESVDRAALAATHGADLDPLAKHEAVFAQPAWDDVDVFELFLNDRIVPRGRSNKTLVEYRRMWRDYREWMSSEDRHPACPSREHVRRYIAYLRDDRGLARSTIKTNVWLLNRAYRFWQDDNIFPHGEGFDPFALAWGSAAFDDDEQKEHPDVPLDDLRRVIDNIKHVRDRAIVVLQLKLGARAGEIANMEIQDLHIGNRDLLDHYDPMGTHPRLDGNENAVIIPHDREGNKSQRTRMLPLDDESRRVLLDYLLIRPDTGDPHVFLSTTRYNAIKSQTITETWADHFRPEFAETERCRAVGSHFGRHYFTTHFEDTVRLSPAKVDYMRGDVADTGRTAPEHYVHVYYRKIEDPYREHIYRLGVI